MRAPPKSVLALALAAIIALVAIPALRGSWVYDDNLMVDNPLMDEPSDLLHVFSYNSTHYLRRDANAPPGDGDFTYRPITMATLTAVQSVSPAPLLHHIASLGMHLLVVFLLGMTLVRQGIDWRFCLLGAAAFGLHPAAGEAWLWINGRSDLVAGIFVAGLALLVAGPMPSRRDLRVFSVILVALLVGGTLSKETFLPAAGAVFGMRLFASTSETAARRTVFAALGIIGAIVAVVALLALRAQTSAGVRAVPAEFDVATLLGRTPALLGLALETIALPLPRAMRALFFELHTLWTPSRALFVALAVTAGLVAALRRRPAALIALAGIAVCLLPTAITTDSFWLGFDRYLYMPILLVVLATAGTLAPTATIAPAAADDHRPLPRGLAIAATFGLALAAGSTWATARNYRSHAEFEMSMLESRPDDPTGYVYVGGTLIQMGRTEQARQLLADTPRGDWPWLVLYSIEELQRAAGLETEARATLDTMLRVAPGEARVRLEAIAWAVRAGDVAAIGEHAAAITVNDETCELAAAWIQSLRGGAGLRADVRGALDAAGARFASCAVDED